LLCSVEKDTGCDLIHKVQEELESQGNVSIARGDSRIGKTIAKHD
jgi:hypothetical protein